MAKNKNQLKILAIVIALIFVVLIIFIQKGAISTKEQRIQAMLSSGKVNFFCKLRTGQIFQFPVLYNLVEDYSAGETKFILHPNFTAPSQEASELVKQGLYLGNISSRELFRLIKNSNINDLPISLVLRSDNQISSPQMSPQYVLVTSLYEALKKQSQQADVLYSQLLNKRASQDPASSYKLNEAQLQQAEQKEARIYNSLNFVLSSLGVLGKDKLPLCKMALGILIPPRSQQGRLPFNYPAFSRNPNNNNSGSTNNGSGSNPGYCGDGYCDPALGEDSASCSVDCGDGGGPSSI